jgi:hypothetical protein
MLPSSVTPSEILTAFRALPLHRRHEAMRMACSYAADVWERYAEGGSVTYTDGVVGMQHVLDMTLPARALAAVDRKLAGDHVAPEEIWSAYREPITALQDEDLDLPDDIARAYRAIYNLFGLVFKRLILYDDGDIIIQQALTREDMISEWWMRTWDAWASRADFKPPKSELDAVTFRAICEGRTPASYPENRLGAVLLALAGRTDEACALAARVLGIDDDRWLRENILRIGGSDAIAVGRDHYAVIHGNHYCVREIDDNRLRMNGQGGCAIIRHVAVTPSLVIFAGNNFDEIGPYESVLFGEEPNSTDYGYRIELRGARTIAALSSKVDIVPASDREVCVINGGGIERFGDGAVEGATFSDDGEYLVTWAGARFTLWNRPKRRKLLALELTAPIWHAVFGSGRLMLALRGEHGRFVDLR